jgi:hypothetical protein
VDVLSVEFSIVRKTERTFLLKPVDEELNELAFVDFTVCLLLFARYIRSKQTSQITGFERY